MIIYTLLMLSWLCLLSMQQLLNRYRRRRIRRWWVKPHLRETVRRRLTKLKGPRAALDPKLRLAAVLSYLVHSSSARKAAWSFYIGRSTMYKLIPEVCNAIHLGLKDHYLKFPSTNEEWLEISNGFLYIFDFPNCIGALDGKHFRIKRPPHSGSWFWNFKKFYSIVLMAVCDARRVFKRVSIGNFGSAHDTITFQASNLGRALDAGAIPNWHTLNLCLGQGDQQDGSSNSSISFGNSMSISSDVSDDDGSSQSSSEPESSDTSMEDDDDAAHHENLTGEQIKDVLANYFTSRLGNVHWQWNLL
ncbi:hypothetical protein QAD02_017164 [Eretmocerus hayati]|uniref:Uncharacterized protein n=1 Tax=Eretmocerus hayati TaxID=131215 RepID=A0ACC2PD49_9HYME|nr:hypothetical protein QAD02_017164 [Eretmocerus hayati]